MLSKERVQTNSVGMLRRRGVLKGAVATGMAVVGAPVFAQAKPFSGVTINGACFQHGYHTAIKEMLPEFEAASGMKVNLEQQSFPVYNQRMDLELSTKGSAYDFCNITFPYSGRWVGSGWLSPLDDLLRDPNATPASWGADDFVGGAQAPFKDAQGRTYGFAWASGAMMMCASRADLIEKAGLKMPQTVEELIQVCAATHNPEIAAFVNDRLHHWNWIPYLMAAGGSVFRNPPSDLTPMLNTPAAATAADQYARLLRSYSVPGVLSFSDDQAMRAQLSGRANIRTSGFEWFLPLAKSAESKVRDTMRVMPMPSGPAGFFPAANSNAYGIPAGSKQKRAAWEFIKWAVSKETVAKLALEKAQVAVARRSVITDPRYRAVMTINGQDVAKIYIDTMELAGQRGYMRYRTLPVYPQVGEKINKAIERVASGQGTGAVAMAQAQEEAIADLRKSGSL